MVIIRVGLGLTKRRVATRLLSARYVVPGEKRLLRQLVAQEFPAQTDVDLEDHLLTWSRLGMETCVYFHAQEASPS